MANLYNNLFYGNANSFSSKGFVFDKIYPNKTELILNGENDQVFLGRFVLIDYYYTNEENYLDNEEIYKTNLQIDIENEQINTNCHSQVYMKTTNGYLEVARLETTQYYLNVDNRGYLELIPTAIVSELPDGDEVYY